MNTPTHVALRESARRISPIWFVPLVAAAIGLWMGWHSYTTRGTLITIRMDTAEGIEAGKTLIKARNVAVGKVENVRLSEAFDHIVITARMNPDSQRLLREDTQFWVVKPRVGREGISGLGTVLSGVFIRLQPGKADASRDSFVALEQPPTTPRGAKGLRVQLTSTKADAASAGDPVSFQGYNVGRVENAEFDIQTRQLRYRLFIRPPFDTLVTSNTRFWTRSGVKMTLNSEGVSIDMSSLEGLLGGGIAFGVPEGLSRGEPVTADASFTLYPDAEAARQGSFDRHLAYILMMDDTVRGLSKGAPVEFRGVRIGTVVEVPYELTTDGIDPLLRETIPVLIHIEPQRLVSFGAAADDAGWRVRFADLIQDGLRASLKSGNLLTGALFVDLDFHPDLPPPEPGQRINDIEELPTAPSGFAQLEHKLSRLLDKLNQMPVEAVLSNLDANLRDSRQLLVQLQGVSAHLDQLLQSRETTALPGALLGGLQELRQTLNGFSSDAPAYRDLSTALQRLDALMRDLQPVLRTLDERPNALIFNRPRQKDPEPRASRP